MRKIYFKHLGLPIPDLFIAYEINAEKKTVRLELNDHLDSALLIEFLVRLECDEAIQLIDNRSKDTFGPANIPGRFDIELLLSGMLFDVRVVEMGSWGQSIGTPSRLTLCMKRRA